MAINVKGVALLLLSSVEQVKLPLGVCVLKFLDQPNRISSRTLCRMLCAFSNFQCFHMCLNQLLTWILKLRFLVQWTSLLCSSNSCVDQLDLWHSKACQLKYTDIRYDIIYARLLNRFFMVVLLLNRFFMVVLPLPTCRTQDVSIADTSCEVILVCPFLSLIRCGIRGMKNTKRYAAQLPF
jgi:hypothetical protein